MRAAGEKRLQDVPKSARLVNIESTLLGMNYDISRNIATERYGLKTTWEIYYVGEWEGATADGGGYLDYKPVSYETYINSPKELRKVETKDIGVSYEHFISDQSPQKSLYFYYMREASRWRKLRDELGEIISAAEQTIHEETMLGIGGPGFLTNKEGCFALNIDEVNDPYLMTKAELEYELARRKREYWAKRLEIAKAVLDYAIAEGPRESALFTEVRKDEAKIAMEAARAHYEESLKSIQYFIDQMAIIKGKKPISDDEAGWEAYRHSIAYLASELEKKKWELEKAEEDYRIYSRALIVLEDGQDVSFIQRQLLELQNTFLGAEKDLAEKRKDYYNKLRFAEGYERLKGYAELISEAAESWSRAKHLFESFSEIVFGDGDDDAISIWGEMLFAENNATLWEGKEKQYEALRALYAQCVLLPLDVVAKREFLAALHGEYIARKSDFAISKFIITSLLDDAFCPSKYLRDYETMQAKKKAEIDEQYRAMQERALKLIANAMKEAKEKEFLAIINNLPEIPSYKFGGNNESFLIAIAARAWAEENLKDINRDTWEMHKAKVEDLIDHQIMDDFFMMFERFEGRWSELCASFEALKTLCVQKEPFFAQSDAMARTADFDTSLVAYVQNVMGNSFTLTRDFFGMSEREFADVARAMSTYVNDEISKKWYVPLAMKELARELAAAGRELEMLLYVRDHAFDRNFLEDAAAKKTICETGSAAVSFAESALDAFNRFGDGNIDAITLWKDVGTLENTLSDPIRAYLADVVGTSDFLDLVAQAHTSLNQFEIATRAREYLDCMDMLGLEEFIAVLCAGKSTSFIAQFKEYLENLGCVNGQFQSIEDFARAMVQVEEDMYIQYSIISESAEMGREALVVLFDELGRKQSDLAHEYAKAEKLVEYHDNPKAFICYRNYVQSMWKDTNGAKFTITAVSYPKDDYFWWLYAPNPLLDGWNADGSRSTIVYGQEDASGRMLESMILESVNKIANLICLLRDAAKLKDTQDNTILDTSLEFAQMAKSLFDDAEKETSSMENFIAKIKETTAAAQSLALARGINSLAPLKNEVESRQQMLFSQVGQMRDLSKTAAAMAMGKANVQAAFFEKSKLRDEKQKEFSALSKSLEEAQARYCQATNAYIAAMNEMARHYKEFKEREHLYEKAYAVWEYAHTPYLLYTIAKDAQTGEGEMPTAKKEALSALDPADARERYKRTKEAFEIAESEYLLKKAAMDAQEQLKDLANDERYRSLREQFKTEAESHARFDRAATIIAEHTAFLASEVEMLRKKYAAAKDSFDGFIKIQQYTDTDGQVKEKQVELSASEKLKRDAILGRMLAEVQKSGMENLIMLLVRENNLKRGLEIFKTNQSNFYSWYCPPANKDGGSGSYISYNNRWVVINEYNALKAAYALLFEDIEYLRSNDIGYSSLIGKVAEEYYSWKNWYNKYLEAESKCDKWEKWWCNNARHRREQARIHGEKFNTYYSQLSEYLFGVLRARNDLEAKEKLLASYEQVKTAEEFRTKTFASDKVVDNRHFLVLTDLDRSRIFDQSDGRLNIGQSDVDITPLRKKVMRKDIDGNILKARVVGNRVYVLSSEGRLTNESYELWQPYVLLSSDPLGENILSKENIPEGDYYLVDYVYSASEVARAVASKMSVRRMETKSAFESYAAESVKTGKHDFAVVLRDKEDLYNALLTSVATIGDNQTIVYTFEFPSAIGNIALPIHKITITKNTGTKTSRRYAGYSIAVNELIGAEGSISADIVKNLVKQSAQFQEQQFEFITNTYQLKKKEWMEAVTFIKSRGERDWAEGLYEIQQSWRKWKIETRGKIAESEKKWNDVGAQLEEMQKKWAAETAAMSAEAVSKMIGKDIEAEIRNAVAGISAKLPGNIVLAIDAEKIYTEAIKNMPKAELSVLAQGMMAVSTTMGITEMLNLGLSSSIKAAFKDKMIEFENSMKVMKNLRLSEAVTAMIKSFENNLKEANERNYHSVKNQLAVSFPAPFERDRSNRKWKICVVSSHSLVETNYRILEFMDYQDFVNTMVKLKEIRTLGGGLIDFTNPATYNMLDADELEMYVTLETDHLKREIDRVFTGGEASEFGKHTKTEFDRLQEEFEEKFAEYMKGQALVGMGWYSVPIAPGIPVNTLTLVKVTGSIALSSTLGPWAAFAMNAMCTALEAKDGGLSWKQAALKVGIDAAITGVTWGAGQLGTLSGTALGMSKDGLYLKNGLELMKAGFSTATSTVLGTLASCVQYNMDGSISWDQHRFHDNKTWSGAGLSFITNFGTQALSIGLRAGVDEGEGKNVKTYSISSNLVHTAISSTLCTLSANFKIDEDGSLDWQGFGNIEVQKAVVEWAGIYASTVMTGGMREQYFGAFMGSLISTYTKKGVSELFEHYCGRDFGDTFSLDKPVSVDTLSIAMNQSLDSVKQKILVNMMTEKERQNYEFFNADNRTVWHKFKAGFTGVVESFGSMLGSLKNEFNVIVSDAITIGKGIGNGVASLWNGAGNLLTKAKNAIGGLFHEQRSAGDIWAKYFGDGKYLKMSKADQEILWRRYSEEMSANGIDVTEEKGKGIESRYWMRAIKEMVGYKELSKEGVNIIGIRKDSKDGNGGYSKTRYDDVFLVIIDGELKGVFYGSTEPGAKGSKSKAYTVLDEGQYEFVFNREHGFRKNLKHGNEILTPYDKKGVNAKMYDDNGNLIKNFNDTAIFFHYGGNKELVGRTSLGCQIISGGGFIDANGRYVSGREYTGKNPAEALTGSGMNQGAYNAFISLIKESVIRSGKDSVNYSLVNEKRINYDIFYQNYRESLGLK